MAFRKCEMCEARTGYPHYFRSLDKLNQHKREMHPKKKSTNSRRRIPREIRSAVLKRDKHRCVDCGTKTDLQLHHLKYYSDGGTDDADNLVTVCELCHAERHRGEAIYRIMIQRLFKQISV